MLPDLCLRKVLTKMWEAVERYFLTASLETREGYSLTPVLWESTLSLPLLLSLPLPISFHLGPPSPPQMENRKYRHFQGY